MARTRGKTRAARAPAAGPTAAERQQQASQQRVEQRQRNLQERREAERAAQEERDQDYTERSPENPPEMNTARVPEETEAEENRREEDERLVRETMRAARTMDRAKLGLRPAEGDEPEEQREPTETKEFILLGGEHREKGVKYVYSRDAEVRVPSDRPLDVLFANKFRAVDEPTRTPRTFRQLVDRPGLFDRPMAQRRPHGQFSEFTADADAAAQERLEETRVAAARRTAGAGEGDEE